METMDIIKKQKQELRKVIKEKIALLSVDECQASDALLYERVLALPEFRNANTIFCYVGAEGEINTLPILQEILATGKILAVPKCISKGVMNAYPIRSLTELQPGKYGILEPISSEPAIEPANIDLCFVPCLTCSKDGKRLGYGGGYYDRYLTQADFIKITLCRTNLLVDDLPVEEHDVRMDLVITDHVQDSL